MSKEDQDQEEQGGGIIVEGSAPPSYLPPNFMEMEHRRIVNPENQHLIIFNGHLYWAGSRRYVGPVALLKPTCPKEYYFCDYCGGTFTAAFSADEDHMSLAKHYEEKHRDIVVSKIQQPRGSKGVGYWTPTTEAITAAARQMAGEHKEVEPMDPLPAIHPVPDLKTANKKAVRTAQLVTEPAAPK